MVKKISIILALVLCMSALSVCAEATGSFLGAVNILPDEYGIGGESEVIPYDQFLYMTARMLSNSESTPQKTRFSDVDESNPYSGYIEFLAGSGIIAEKEVLNPKASVSVDKAVKIVMKVLGYMESDENTLLDSAFSLELYDGVETKNGMLTYSGASRLAENALSAQTVRGSLVKTITGESFFEYNKSGETLLAKCLGLSSYSGVVTEVDTKAHSVKFRVEKDMNNGTGTLTIGETVSLDCQRSINIGQVKYAPVTVWVNEDDEIVFVKLNKNVEIKFGLIVSVNENKDKDAWYVGSAIKEISIQDEGTFDVSEQASFYMNETYSVVPEQWNNKVARFVISKGEIISVESWELTEGGLITEAGVSEISYLRGDMNLRFKNISDAEQMYVYIDGRCSEISELKANSVFDYYKDGKNLVIVASEGVVSDVMQSIGQGTISIGGFIYKSPETYFKTGKSAYVKGVDNGKKLLGENVKGYIGPDGAIAYLESASSKDEGVYFALVLGTNTPSTLDPDEFEIKLLTISPEITNGIYKVTKRTSFEGVIKEDVKANKATAAVADLYEVFLNGKEIKSIKPAAWFKGYGERAEVSISSFVNQGTAMQSVNGKMLFFPKAKIVFVFENFEGELTAQQMPWSQLQGRSCTGKMGFYCYSGNEYTSIPDIVMINGTGVKDLANVTTPKHGVVTGKSIGIDENGEEVVLITVNNGTRAQEYALDITSAKSIPERAYIQYRDGLTLSTNEITIDESKMINLTGAPETWPLAALNASEGLAKGTVERVDELRLFYKDTEGNSDVDFYHPSFNFFVKYNKNKPQNPFSAASYADIQPDDTVYFYNSGEGLKGVIIVK